MTFKDFLKRVSNDDLEKMMIYRENKNDKGWSNINVDVKENEITIFCDRNRPFSCD
ncbi:hypothetical protein [Clostridium botulinum]|uniref:hypothetical protein n=1 Tax=Clostridium botulinum TaxID=1491 RepID=UPI001C9AE3E1|nr:hypothetical protein [Clostridium botulinum]MBY6842785.1 hypothetical protein [Clostridium botulinum]